MTAVRFCGIRRKRRAVRLADSNARSWPSGWVIREIRDIRGFSFLCLSVCSVVNNNLKPDGMPPYHFQYSGSTTNYTEGVDEFYRQAVIYVSAHQTLHLMNETERYRIFAYCAESRSRTLGRVTGNVTGFTEWNLRSAMGYEDDHYSHSREFRSNIAAERDFWIKVKANCEGRD